MGEQEDMKQYFKHGNGYVNINAENLFITKSGNWKETEKLAEKSRRSRHVNSRRVKQIEIVTNVIYFIATVTIFATINKSTLSLPLMAALAGSYYFISNRFKFNTDRYYKIPLSKIESAEHYKDGIKLFFRNAVNETDFDILVKAEPKGFKIFEALNLLHANYHEIKNSKLNIR